MKKLAILFVLLLAAVSACLVGSESGLLSSPDDSSHEETEADPSTDPDTWEDPNATEPATEEGTEGGADIREPDSDQTRGETTGTTGVTSVPEVTAEPDFETSSADGGESDPDEGSTTPDPGEESTEPVDTTESVDTAETEAPTETESDEEISTDGGNGAETTAEPETPPLGAETLPPAEETFPAEDDSSLEETTAPGACSHTPGDWEVVREASCTEEGSRVKRCLTCQALLNEESIPTVPHTEVITPGRDATEGFPGVTAGIKCGVCGVILQKPHLIPALGESVTSAESRPSDEPPAEIPPSAEAVVWNGEVAEGFAGGTGGAEDPYLISNGAQLAYLAERINSAPDSPYADAYYRLTAFIDLNGLEWTPIGNGDGEGEDRNAFSGHLDGNGYSITNFRITRGSGCLGLFGCVDGGSITALGVTDYDIRVSASGTTYCGGLVGELTGTLEACYAKGSIAAEGAESVIAGGLVGLQYGGSIRRCYANCDTEAGAKGISANAWTGGLVGTLTGGGEVTDSYALGNARSAAMEGAVCAFAGGLCGELSAGTVRNCFAFGDVASEGALVTCAGSLFGANGGTADNCYGYAGQSVQASGGNDRICAAENTCTAADLRRVDFYTAELAWEAEEWRFAANYFPVPLVSLG